MFALAGVAYAVALLSWAPSDLRAIASYTITGLITTKVSEYAFEACMHISSRRSC